jgi:hypothetical protein
MYEVVIDEQRRRVVTTWGTSVTGASLIDYQRSVWSDPRVRGFDELIDFRALVKVDVSGEDLRTVASLAVQRDEEGDSSRFAIVASTSLTFGLSRMYQILRDVEDASKREVMVFQVLDEASAWLDEKR